MHGFEAIGADFAVDHGATPIMSVAQDHSDACSPDIPHAAVMKVRPVCPFAVSFPSLINNTLAAAAHVPSNREVLTAFSILVV